MGRSARIEPPRALHEPAGQPGQPGHEAPHLGDEKKSASNTARYAAKVTGRAEQYSPVIIVDR